MKKTAWSVGKNSHHKAPENISAVRNAGIDITNKTKAAAETKRSMPAVQ